jgi:hypothetical protein
LIVELLTACGYQEMSVCRVHGANLPESTRASDM